jgi:hypothetical protein
VGGDEYVITDQMVLFMSICCVKHAILIVCGCLWMFR